MKVLVLVLYSEDLPVYKEHLKVWRMYAKSNPSFDVYFMKLSTEHDQVTVDGDFIYTPGEESLWNAPNKFISSVEACPYQSYNYIIKTSISAFWVLHNVIPVLEKLPNEKVFAGEVYGNFVSGAGMIFSPDVCDILVKHKNDLLKIEFTQPLEDVHMSFYLHKTHAIPFTQTFPKRFDIELPRNGTESDIPMDSFHFRVKQSPEERMREYDIMMNLYKKFYSN